MKPILVTGASGFIGSHLTERLVELGYPVKAFVHYNFQNKWGWLDHSQVKNDIEVVSGDIRDYDSVSKAVKGCDTVFHLAALIGIPYSYSSPIAYIKTNVIGSYNVLQTSLEHDLDNVLITSTSETYGMAQYVPIDENHPLKGQSPYSATKIAADELARSYHLSFGLPLKIVRPFNTYGPRQSNRAIIPTIICQIISGSKEIKLGNLNPTRDLNYVKDTVNGFINIFQSSSTIGKVINIAQNTEYSIGEVVNQIQKIMGTKLPVVIDDDRLRPDNSEVFRLSGDNSRLKELT
nr:SDR family NAD(P)-dependent oxidoreductase [Bacteroidota bacterium]